MTQLSLLNGALTGVQTGNGRDLLILHSLLTDRHAFDPVIPALRERFRVTLINLPGFHGPRPAAALMETFAARLADGVRDLGLPADTILMGNGFGGFVSVALAIRHGGLFGRFIFADAGAGFPESGKEAFRVMARKVATDGMGAIADIAARRVFHDAYLATHPSAVAERREVLLGIDPDAFAAACQILVALDMKADIRRIRAPSLVVVGELDTATPPELGRELVAGIPGALFQELKGCGHCPPLEQPQAFLAAIDGFLTAGGRPATAISASTD